MHVWGITKRLWPLAENYYFISIYQVEWYYFTSSEAGQLEAVETCLRPDS